MSKGRKPILNIPIDIADMFRSIALVTDEELAARSETLEDVLGSDEMLGELPPFSRQLITLFVQKSIEISKAEEEDDADLEKDLRNEAYFLYGMFDFMVQKLPEVKKSSKHWSVCRGFMLVLRDRSDDAEAAEQELDTDAESGDNDDDDAEPRMRVSAGAIIRKKNGKTVH